MHVLNALCMYFTFLFLLLGPDYKQLWDHVQMSASFDVTKVENFPTLDGSIRPDSTHVTILPLASVHQVVTPFDVYGDRCRRHVHSVRCTAAGTTSSSVSCFQPPINKGRKRQQRQGNMNNALFRCLMRSDDS